MEKLKLYTVTKPSSDGTFVAGDIIWLSENGDLNSCDVYLALNQIIQVHSTMQKVSDERFLTMSEGVAKLIHTDFSKVTVLEEE